MRWCIDTSALIEPWVRHYPPDIFPPLWDAIRSLADDGVLGAPIDVRHELERQSDDLCKWAKARPKLFLEADRALLERSADIVNKHPGFIDPKSARSGADPFVIALAEIRDVPVVTYEIMGKAHLPRIPNVCRARGVKVATFVEMMRKEGLKF